MKPAYLVRAKDKKTGRRTIHAYDKQGSHIVSGRWEVIYCDDIIASGFIDKVMSWGGTKYIGEGPLSKAIRKDYELLRIYREEKN